MSSIATRIEFHSQLSFINLNVRYEGAIAEEPGDEKRTLGGAAPRPSATSSCLLALVRAIFPARCCKPTGVLLASVEMQAAAFVDGVCGTSVGIPDEDPSWLIGMVHEYGGINLV